jgi:5-methylcytosine-specific restriction endonuclease McrA
MIPIDYSGSLKKYNQFITDFRKEMKKVIDKGYIGNRKKTKVKDALAVLASLSAVQKKKYEAAISKDKKQKGWKCMKMRAEILAPKMLDDKTIKVLTFLYGAGDDLFQCKPGRLLSYVVFLESVFLKRRKDKAQIIEELGPLFVDLGYEKKVKGKAAFPKDELIEATGTKVCPYCNRVFVENVAFSGGGSVKGQLDHFYPKESYPYLAISRYNLVPCCPFCNGSSGKGNKDPRKLKMVNPYSLTSAQGLKFKTNIRRKGFLNLLTCADAVDVSTDTKALPDMNNNCKVFHLKEIYNHHKDYMAEMYYKYNMMKTPAYKKFAVKMLGLKAKRGPWKIRLSKSDWDRIIFGVYTEETDYHRRPMSKFCMDMVDDFRKKRM